jgi:hypothetical protein
MPFATYQAFRVGVEKLIEGDDIGSTFSTTTLDYIIELAEARVYRDLRASTMVSDLSVVLASNEAALPADLIELRQVYFADKAPLEVVPLDRLRRLAADGYGGGTARYCAQDGDSLVFWPEASGTLLGSYYAKPEPLVTVTPFSDALTFHRYPDVFVFAALVEAMPFLGMEAKPLLWGQRYQQALQDAMQDERMRVYGSGRLRVRTS